MRSDPRQPKIGRMYGKIKVNGVAMDTDAAAEKVAAEFERLSPGERDAAGKELQRQIEVQRLVRAPQDESTLRAPGTVRGHPLVGTDLIDKSLSAALLPSDVPSAEDIVRTLDPLSLEEKRNVLKEVAKEHGVTERDIKLARAKKRLARLEVHGVPTKEDEAAAELVFCEEMAEIHAPFVSFCKMIRGYEPTVEPGAHLMALGRIFVGEEDASAAELAELVQAIEEVVSFHARIYSSVVPNWEAGLAYLRTVLDEENSAFPIYFSRRWARVGYPVVELGHKVAASLMFTHGSGVVEAPWPAFSLKIPDGLVSLRYKGVDGTVTRVLCMRPTDRWNKWLIRMDFRKTTGPDAGAEKSFYLSPTALDDTFDLRSDSGDSWPELNRACEMVCRLAAGACMLATAKQDIVEREWRPKVKAERRRTPGVEPPIGTRFIVAKNVELDLREQVHEYILGKARKGGKLTVQFVVRGHRRWQACGPKHSERKLIWINPFWKGPEEGRALFRGYEFKTETDEIG